MWAGRDVKQYNCFRCNNTGSSRQIVWVVSQEVGFGANGKQYELWPVGHQEDVEASIKLWVFFLLLLGLVVGLSAGAVTGVF